MLNLFSAKRAVIAAIALAVLVPVTAEACITCTANSKGVKCVYTPGPCTL